MDKSEKKLVWPPIKNIFAFNSTEQYSKGVNLRYQPPAASTIS